MCASEEVMLNKDEMTKLAQGNEKGVFMSKAFSKLFAF